MSRANFLRRNRYSDPVADNVADGGGYDDSSGGCIADHSTDGAGGHRRKARIA